jgi:hypothetical protein
MYVGDTNPICRPDVAHGLRTHFRESTLLFPRALQKMRMLCRKGVKACTIYTQCGNSNTNNNKTVYSKASFPSFIPHNTQENGR